MLLGFFLCRIIDEPEVTAFIEQIDSASVLAIWQRAAWNMKENDQKQERMIANKVIDDLTKAISMAPHNAYLLYNRGNVLASQGELSKAEDDYTSAIAIDPHLVEAYYNRGIVRLKENKTKEAILDLGKAGEGGLYKAYSVIKKHSK